MIHPWDVPVALFFDLPLKLRSSQNVKTKAQDTPLLYVCVLPASALWRLSAWLWRYKIRENYPNSKIFLRKSIRRCAKLFTGAFIAPTYKTPKGQWVQGRICKNLKKTCQNSISRSPEQGVHDTILTRNFRRIIRLAFPRPFFRRFSAVFSSFMYLTDIQWYIRLWDFSSCLQSVRNRAKCLQYSQSCSLRQSVLRPHFDYFASSLWLSCILTLTILHCRIVKTAPQTAFSPPGNLIFLSPKECMKVSAAECLWHYICIFDEHILSVSLA